MIDIPRHESGVTRVFSLSLSADEAARLRDDPAQQAALLGVDGLSETGVEIFPLDDLSELGLSGYLSEGLDLEEGALKRDAAKLSALEGWVMLVHSPAFGGREVTLKPAPELTLIGTYGQTRDDRPAVPLEAEAAQPYTGHPQTTPPPPAPRNRSGSLAAAAVALMLAGLIWWLLT